MDFASIPKPGKSLKAAPAKVLVRIKALVADLGEEHESYFGLMFTVTDIGEGATAATRFTIGSKTP